MSRPVPAPQPDLRSRLLAAVAERDHTLACRLGQQWVHRRGLAALDHFLHAELAPSQGLEAAEWLQGQLGLRVVAAEAPQEIEPAPQEIDEVASAEHDASLPVARPAALFGRMKSLLRQCLEDVIVGRDADGAEVPCQEPHQEAPAGAAPLLPAGEPRQPSTTPAPAPPSLAALRAWLPDAEEDGRDLPRAC